MRPPTKRAEVASTQNSPPCAVLIGETSQGGDIGQCLVLISNFHHKSQYMFAFFGQSVRLAASMHFAIRTMVSLFIKPEMENRVLLSSSNQTRLLDSAGS